MRDDKVRDILIEMAREVVKSFHDENKNRAMASIITTLAKLNDVYRVDEGELLEILNSKDWFIYDIKNEIVGMNYAHLAHALTQKINEGKE